MTHEQFEQAAQYWNKKEKITMPEEALKQAVEKYIHENNTCALATGSGDYVRCTPIEYSYHDGKFWMFSEGGEKFIGLEKNANVSLAIFDKYDGFGNLKSLQIMGRAEIIEPFSDSYNAHAEYKKIPLEALKKLEHETAVRKGTGTDRQPEIRDGTHRKRCPKHSQIRRCFQWEKSNDYKCVIVVH